MNYGEIVARALIGAGAFAVNCAQPFTYASGRKSPCYLNCRNVQGHPVPFRSLVGVLADSLRDVSGLDLIASVPNGAVPYGVAVSYALQMGHVWTNTSPPKDHGVYQQFFGADPKSKWIHVIEDVATSGDSIVKIVDRLEKAGGRIQGVTVLFSYNPEKVKSLFAARGIAFCALATLPDILAHLKTLDERAATMVADWYGDQVGWYDRFVAAKNT